MQLVLGNNTYILTEEGIDCSLSMQGNAKNVRAWYVDAPKIEPVRANGWVGSVEEGGSVNFRNIEFNPHGHGTHTECLGHITKTVYSVNKTVSQLLYTALLVTVEPESRLNADGTTDLVVGASCFKEEIAESNYEALLIRTLPNHIEKTQINYSDTNPIYFDVDVIPLLNRMGILHLLVDTPSVDREKDGGVLAFHHAFWEVPQSPRFDRTITEMIYLEDGVEDGDYMLNLQTAPFENDATPSRPVLYPLHSYDED